MTSAPTTIAFDNLTKLEGLDLKTAAPGETTLDTKVPQGARFGFEPVTVAVVLVTLTTIEAIAGWLLKNRKQERIEHTITLEFPDGTKQTQTLSIDLSASTAPKADVLDALGRLTHVDVSSLAGEPS